MAKIQNDLANEVQTPYLNGPQITQALITHQLRHPLKTHNFLIASQAYVPEQSPPPFETSTTELE